MTKLADLKKHVADFETKAQKPIKANKGGDTWVQVQQIADRVPAAVKPSIHAIEDFRDSRDPVKVAKIPAYIKTMRTQLNAIALAPVTKYITEHRVGGSNARGSLSTAAAKAEEKKRVAMAGELVRLVGLLHIELHRLDAVDR